MGFIANVGAFCADAGLGATGVGFAQDGMVLSGTFGVIPRVPVW